MTDADWHDLGAVEDLIDPPLRQVVVGRTRIALSWRDGQFGAISGACNHVGGPLGEGTLENGYVVCPWHGWKFHHQTGVGEPGFEHDHVPRYDLRQEGGRLWVNLKAATKRQVKPHDPHPLARTPAREPGPVRVVGIGTTNMDEALPRYSTSDALLGTALDHARAQGAETRHIRLHQLRFRACEGYYSKSAHACTWPCSITQMDPDDQMDQVYEAVVHWADVFVVASPIRWGSASALYFKMIERMNCIQNQVTIRNKVLLHHKVASFIITGGQDNVQAVAGQMMMFFGELGCHFPPFPFIAHSRGWDSEDMAENVRVVRESEELRAGARELVDRALSTANLLIEHGADRPGTRAGRKGYGAGGPR